MNDRGETVIATSVPRDIAAKRGYEIINQKGRVLEVVNPELSYEARQALSFKKKLEEQRQASAQKQAQEDADLRKQFSSVEDVDRSLERVLEEIDNRIAVIKGNSQRLRVQHQYKQTQAAEMERSGQKVSENLLQDMANIAAELDSFAVQITEFEREKDEARKDYALRKDRVRHLLAGEQALTRNKYLAISPRDLVGLWQPVKTNTGVISWEAKDDGVFILTRKTNRGLEKWSGRWSLSRGKDIVVIFFRKEVTRMGKTSRNAFAREERYSIIDKQDEALHVYWEDGVLKFKKSL
ncbi:hypothetical protein [Sansalvadorimonas verongulae]|uniref:hypothetical protein n=1 Tax=Sansalvadorimonas verongulae TaxID=2172824 RepID=UPI0012BCDF30|nr:hypothetical protein [Sansalvadorimonas verongulae]MTI13711.1 hypothetical protein [Sansalvadorimonas verongulae]